jgi:predicted DNA-binding antitoxin AbrB/MazE fold protein
MWFYLNSEITELPENIVGFVYQITNLTNNRKYIGKKLAKFTKTKTRTVKLKSGEKRKKKIRTKEDSDWREYWSSSEELKKDVEKLGEQNFRREILHFCNSKGMLSYMELKEQMENRVLETDGWYNGIIQCRISKTHLK